MTAPHLTILTCAPARARVHVGTGALDDRDFEAIEMAVRRRAMREAARVVERQLNADTSDQVGPMLPCAWGKSARYAGPRGENFGSVLGRTERNLLSSQEVPRIVGT